MMKPHSYHSLIAVLLFVLFQGAPPPGRPPKPGSLNKTKKPPPQPVSMDQV